MRTSGAFLSQTNKQANSRSRVTVHICYRSSRECQDIPCLQRWVKQGQGSHRGTEAGDAELQERRALNFEAVNFGGMNILKCIMKDRVNICDEFWENKYSEANYTRVNIV